MYRLEKQFRFEAAHHLPEHDGKCRRLHGHSWKGTLIIEGEHLIKGSPKDGMLVDFGDLSNSVSNLLEDYLDHWNLNERTGLVSPTSEAIAHWIYSMLKPKLPLLVAIRIEETCTSACEYRE